MKINCVRTKIIQSIALISILSLMGCTQIDSNQESTFETLIDSIDININESEYNSDSVLNINYQEDYIVRAKQIVESGDTSSYWDEKVEIANPEDFECGYEVYSELDDLGRCGIAQALVCTDIMPTEKRGAIGQVKPTGWHTVKYDCVDGKYLYNRCHLIGFQLAGENANKLNLITGTRYMNVDGMLTWENKVANHAKETGHHIMYQVIPVYEGINLVAYGVEITADCIEDDDIDFCVFCPNIQPGVQIDYVTGDSSYNGQSGDTSGSSLDGYEDSYLDGLTDEDKGTMDYMVNTNTLKFHNPECSSIKSTSENNKESFNGPRKWLIDNGYEPCGRCKP